MISNSVTLFRMSLVIPLFFVLAIVGPSWIALVLFLGAGALDVVDGRLARHFNESSELGAMLDLIADRLLTLSAVAGLLIAGTLSLLSASAAVFLVVRCTVFGSFGEALRGRTHLKSSNLEPAKIAFSFAGLSLALSPYFNQQLIGLDASSLVSALLVIAALLAMLTMIRYARETMDAFNRN